jgi:NADH:ubiquinone oxidoreductase subunit E
MARDLNDLKHVVMVCHGSDCKHEGAKELAKAVKDCARELGLMRDTLVVKTKCTGACKRAPVMSIQPANVWLTRATPAEAIEAFRASAKPFRLVS